MSVNSKMTAIADEIRILSGTTGTMGLDAMATNISDVNSEINSQADLIAQIAMVLEGKSATSSFNLQDDGNGNVIISGIAITDDGNGNLMIEGS